MTTASQRTKRKLSLLQLAEELGNVSKACRIMDYHGDTFYEVQKAFKVGGGAPWSRSGEARGTRIPTASRRPSSSKSSICASRSPPTAASGSPTSCACRASTSAPPGVRGVWLRHDLATSYKRLLSLKTAAEKQTHVLNEDQVRLLGRHSPEFRTRHAATSPPASS